MEKLLPWIHLKSIPGVGNLIYKRLIDRFGSPEQVFAASAESLLQVDGMSRQLVSSLRNRDVPDSVKRELDRATRRGYRIVPIVDDAYPPLLREIPDPPPFLYVNGTLDGAASKLAIVGSRNATAYGISSAKRLSINLASLGFTIVSGMALGIDTAAHEGALQGGGKTIAVLGSGLERVYPAENRNLFHRISENGAVVSEFPLATAPEAYNFPARNRVISGLSLGTVVVEATRKSGSLITARLAAEQNREVFAVPGSIRSFKSMGTHTLIKQGAKLVENAQDILEELSHALPIDGPHVTAGKPDYSGKDEIGTAIALSEDEQTVLDLVGPYPVHIDQIVRMTGMAPGKVSSTLLQLELKHLISQSPGKYFSRSDDVDPGP